VRNELLLFFAVAFLGSFSIAPLVDSGSLSLQAYYMEIMSFQVLGSGGVSVRAAAVVVADRAGFGEEGQRG
jgi:hypothetical protein